MNIQYLFFVQEQKCHLSLRSFSQFFVSILTPLKN